MDQQSHKIFFEYENSDIFKSLEALNIPKDLLELIVPMICESDLAAQAVIKMRAGIPLPEVVPNNTPVYVKVSTIAYNSSYDEATVRENNNVNDDDEVLCMIQRFRGHHQYMPYKVTCKKENDEHIDFNCRKEDFRVFVDF